MNEPIDLDANATTPLLPAARDAMFALGEIGNPASAHALGRKGRRVLEDARERIAARLGAFPDELIFTSGATEANNLAIFGLRGSARHVLASPMEHPSVVEPLKHLKAEVEWLSVQDGVAQAFLPVHSGTEFVTIQLVNHETGAILPVREIAQSLPPAIPFHTDAAQAVGRMAVNFPELGVASLAASAHKFRGPVGVGVLLLKRGTNLKPQLFGGHQQHGRRPGTESPMLALGMAVALDHALDHLDENRAKWVRLRDRLWIGLQEKAAPVIRNSPADALPTTLNVSFPGSRGDLLLMALDLVGVACSTGSACSSGSLLPSSVLAAMGVPDDVLRSAIRFSFGPELSIETMDEAARRIATAVEKQRKA